MATSYVCRKEWTEGGITAAIHVILIANIALVKKLIKSGGFEEALCVIPCRPSLL